MKNVLFFTTIIGGSFLCSPVFSQEIQTPDSLGLPGDNLNLYGVLDVFQKSETLEEFEKKLNAEDSKVNNLDLNGNDKIDYISVKDNVKGTAHAIVLQVAINEKETQDIAVIEVEKDKNDKVQIQIVGDEALYGKNYIIEPKDESSKSTSEGTPNPGYTGAKSGNAVSGDKKNTTVTNTTNNYYNSNNNADEVWYPVENWRIIHYIYVPTYVVYVSPWRWGFYPGYWNPWAPLFWHSYYYGYHYPHYNHYYGHYHRSYNYRATTAHDYYGQRRSTSPIVNQRREQGEFRKTYSRPDLAPKQVNDGRSPRENKQSNPDRGNMRPEKATPQKGGVNERNAPPRNDNKANRPQQNNRQSPSVKPNRSERHNVSPAQHSAPRSGARPGNKGSGGGKRK